MPVTSKTTRSRRSEPAPCAYSPAPDLVVPQHLWVPDEYDPERTLGPEVAAIATLAGFAPDAEQRMCLDLAFALDKKGKSLAFEFVLIAPRQNLKTGFLKQLALGQLFVRNELLVPWTAHEFATSAEALNDIEALIDGSDDLRRCVKLTSRNGVAKRGAVPEIKLLPRYGSARMIFKTRTSGGGRGLSGRKTILDEAYALQAGQVGALYPIMLAQPDPQIIGASSACRPESAVLWDMVQRGRKGGHRRLIYVEWCAPEPAEVCESGESCTHGRESIGCGCDKPEVIRLVHSAITRGRIQLQTILDLRNSMPPAEYGREVMGWHDAVINAESMLDLSNWPNLENPDAAMNGIPHAFAIAVSKDRAWAAIGVAGKPADGVVGDVLHLEVVERRPGMEWVIPWFRARVEKYAGIPVAIDDHGPAASLIPDLRDLLGEKSVLTLNTNDVADATEQFVDGTKFGRYRHGPQVEVDDAMLVAQPRSLGDGRIALGRKASGGDITALEVLVFAAWAAGKSTIPEIWSIADMVQQIRSEKTSVSTDAPVENPNTAPVRKSPPTPTFHSF